MAFQIREDSNENPGVPIYIRNAGLVLTAVFLPRLFNLLNMLQETEKNELKWRDVATASRAVHLTEFLVNGSTVSPEPSLALNKVVCGVPISQLVEEGIVMTDEETTTCESLLQSMVANWPVLANSSIAALRETFLQREGKLENRDDRWTLQVQRKTVDVLVDRIPWSFSHIRLPWVSKVLYVTW